MTRHWRALIGPGPSQHVLQTQKSTCHREAHRCSCTLEHAARQSPFAGAARSAACLDHLWTPSAQSTASGSLDMQVASTLLNVSYYLHVAASLDHFWTPSAQSTASSSLNTSGGLNTSSSLNTSRRPKMWCCIPCTACSLP